MELADFHEIKDRRLHLLQTEKWADCRFLVGTPANQKIIAGHKLVLAMASPVFERMFYGLLPDKDDPIVIPNVQPEAFQAMLEYIYSDRIYIGSFDEACELCYVTKKYMLPLVVEQCTQYLLAHLRQENACRAYEFAKLIDEPRLMQSSMGVICRNTKEILEDPSFTDIEVSTLMDILDQDKLNICSELDLFNDLLRFSTERGMFRDESLPNAVGHSDLSPSIGAGGGGLLHVEEIKMEPDVNAMIQGHDMNAQRLIFDEDMLRQAVKKIRFLTMTPQQFAEGPARSKILEQHEALAILIKISNPSNNDYPMPEGFCSSRSNRACYVNQRFDQRIVITDKDGNKVLLKCPKFSICGSPW